MTPYVEVRVLSPEPARRWIAMLAIALLVAPVGVLMPGGSDEPLTRAAALGAIAVLAPLLGLALGRPRATLTIDQEAGQIIRRTVGALPDPRAREERWPLASATGAELEETGGAGAARWGVRVDLAGAPSLHLEAFRDVELAQNTLDHLVLLGIPGASRAQQREGQLAAMPPAVWL